MAISKYEPEIEVISPDLSFSFESIRVPNVEPSS